MYERQYCVKDEKKCAFCINPTTTHQLLTMLIFLFVSFLLLGVFLRGFTTLLNPAVPSAPLSVD